MQARFKQFTKRQNSTKRPTGLQLYNVTLKGPCSILKPRLEIKWTGTGDPTLYNMVYISTFGRYYWITNWTYEDRCWVCDCKVDVLASYKTEIGNASKYILRSASSYDTKIIETKYPAKGTSHCVSFEAAGYPWASEIGGPGGRYIVGITGDNNTFGVGGVGYVVCRATEFASLLNAAYTNGQVDWQTSLGQPYQFINSVHWLPVTPNIGSQYTITLGYINTGVGCSVLNSAVSEQSWNITYSSTNGGTETWRNVAPFAKYVYYCGPFGFKELDSTQLVNRNTINSRIIVDAVSGLATLYVTAVNSVGNETSPVLWTETIPLAIPFSIAGIQQDFVSMVTGGIGAIGSAASAIASPSAGNITGAISSIGDFVKSTQPEAKGGGNISGTVSSLQVKPRLDVIYYDPVDEDNTEQGRPLCKVDTISNYSGYLLLADGDVEISGTPEEMAEINSYLTGGFFYE